MSIQELQTGEYRATQAGAEWEVQVVNEDGDWVSAEPGKRHATKDDASDALKVIRAQNEQDFIEGFAEGMGIPVGDAVKVLGDKHKEDRRDGWSRGFETGMECRAY
jgi:hypothetical protein